MILYRKRVFVVEDNTSNLVLMKYLLEREGALVGFERWGRTLLERIEEFLPIDLILMDLMLPNASGYELFETIRAHERYAHIPIVAVSAAAAAEAMPKVREMGFAGFFAKPLELDRFALRLQEIMQGATIFDGHD